MNASGLVRASILAFVGICTLPVPAQQRDGERKVRIEVTRTENGQRTRETREFDLSDERQLADALRELGVMDELNIIGDDENLVLDLKRTREGGMLNDMCVALSLADEAIAQQQPAYLGVYYNDWNGDKGKNAPPVKKGAEITSVEDGTAAEKSGLKAGDVIVGMDD
ncbi:MAG: PDZ domain-containing protein, partial [Flavobacteriales bacterium]|nr:PDZ domain-containing protein [Flavobacteriales bacterium]